jgi:hypothetical protein
MVAVPGPSGMRGQSLSCAEPFFFRESVDVDYSMEIRLNSYGGEVETFAQHVIRANTIDTLKFLNDESFELRDRFPDDVACMANASCS